MKKCKNWRCSLEAAVDQSYCSRECSPFGMLNGVQKITKAHGRASRSGPFHTLRKPGELSSSEMAKRLDIAQTSVLVMAREKKIPCRAAENGWQYFEPAAVEDALRKMGWEFEPTGRARQFGSKYFARKRKAKAS
ncbi:MAG: hypothetical protein ACXWPM_06770 [Bdellovibrionota bacterium]